MLPRVSVLMPVRNGLPWVRDALNSLSSQTLEDFEILALEDGSTDGTADVLASWPDHRLRVIPTGGAGIAAALNIGIEAACAPLIARQDADDLSLPRRLKVQVDYLDARAEVGVLGSAAEYIDAQGTRIDNDWVRTIRRQQDVALRHEQIEELMPLTCCLTHGSVMARTSLLRAVGGYRTDAVPAEDYDLWLRLLPRTRFAKLPARLYQYRVHDSQASVQARERQLLQTLGAKFSYIRRRFPRLPAVARLVVIGSGRGADSYQSLASIHGFQNAPRPAALRDGNAEMLDQPAIRSWALDACDAIVVANFADVDAYERALIRDAVEPAAVRVGNFFIPRRWAAGLDDSDPYVVSGFSRTVISGFSRTTT
jgi:hypothetical protein